MSSRLELIGYQPISAEQDIARLTDPGVMVGAGDSPTTRITATVIRETRMRGFPIAAANANPEPHLGQLTGNTNTKSNNVLNRVSATYISLPLYKQPLLQYANLVGGVVDAWRHVEPGLNVADAEAQLGAALQGLNNNYPSAGAQSALAAGTHVSQHPELCAAGAQSALAAGRHVSQHPELCAAGAQSGGRAYAPQKRATGLPYTLRHDGSTLPSVNDFIRRVRGQPLSSNGEKNMSGAVTAEWAAFALMTWLRMRVPERSNRRGSPSTSAAGAGPSTPASAVAGPSTSSAAGPSTSAAAAGPSALSDGGPSTSAQQQQEEAMLRNPVHAAQVEADQALALEMQVQVDRATAEEMQVEAEQARAQQQEESVDVTGDSD
ncbi:hypothetical protein DUNSADRAFT_15107 [Dunaliella salina]|uniref:Uncharacterized protein n=1 Tax=Dunaliella salina TaxID=3046 RepID=A0ABQ7H216_DUNSA|nr:hypothetical protein DUNSADRAFT_15107 [Dunaliella salina]|eukprot:KAF5840907.1 hypothetical protein DUNSADRAFT_15107 [Dunaliella salina]